MHDMRCEGSCDSFRAKERKVFSRLAIKVRVRQPWKGKGERDLSWRLHQNKKDEKKSHCNENDRIEEGVGVYLFFFLLLTFSVIQTIHAALFAGDDDGAIHPPLAKVQRSAKLDRRTRLRLKNSPTPSAR